MVVAQTLRLGQLSGLEIDLGGHPQESGEYEAQVVVYCDAQAAPVLVAPAQGPQVSVAFGELPRHIARSLLLNVRIFVRRQPPSASSVEDAEWTLSQKHTLSLRQLAQSSSSAPVRIKSGGHTYIAPERPASSHRSLAAAALRQTIGQRAPGAVVSPSFDTLNTILVLQGAIDDAEDASQSARAQINALVPGSAVEVRAKRAALGAKLDEIKSALESTRRMVQEKRQQAAETNTGAETHARRLAESRDEMAVSATDSAVTASTTSNSSLDPLIKAQQARAASVLLEIFPIEIPIDPREQLTICGLPLPAMFVINHFDPVQVGAALGLVAQLVLVLSRYLDVPLPYPIQPLGSQSYISNPLVRIKGSNIFPLWTDGTLLYRLEYGLYLLRQDIQMLLASRQVAVVSPFQVLANLKNLMLVVSN